MPTPPTTTATDVQAACAAIQGYLARVEGKSHVVRAEMQSLMVDLGKLCSAVAALAGAPSGPQVTALNATRDVANRLARVFAGTDP